MRWILILLLFTACAQSLLQTEIGSNSEERFTTRAIEGELVTLSPAGNDPDGDPVSFSFTDPFDQNGTWQTRYGDAGTYDVYVTIADTEGGSSTETVRVVIDAADRPPRLDCPEIIFQREGERVTLDCEATDYEESALSYSYDGWMRTATYLTSFNDAGTHGVTVTVTDEAGNQADETLLIVIEDVNRPPLFPLTFPDQIAASEGDVITIPLGAILDPDGDALTFVLSTPFDERGIWRSEQGDAGSYPVDVVINDGTDSVRRRVDVRVSPVNTAPVLHLIPRIEVREGEAVLLPLAAEDREGDQLEYVISGWMTSPQRQTGYEDAGHYQVKVEVTDGALWDSQVVTVTVQNVNRPPVFSSPG